jgi:uncharacterized protein YbjT (DUF2867 family)
MILVTGATGKVGRHLVAALLDEDAPVRALTRDPAAAGLPAAAELALFDPGQLETITSALAGVTAVFVNASAVGTVIADLMTAASQTGVNRVVLLSSFVVRDNGIQPYLLGAEHKALEDVVAASGLEWGVPALRWVRRQHARMGADDPRRRGRASPLPAGGHRANCRTGHRRRRCPGPAR